MKEVRPPPSARAYILIRRLTFSQTPAFWRDDRLQQLMPVLVSLIPHASTGTVVDQDALLPSSSSSSKGSSCSISSRDIVSAGLVALCNVATDDTLLKRLNLDVLMHTRTEDDAPVRIFALQCARALWTAHGLKLIGERDYYSLFVFSQLADNMMDPP
jgi:U3 small nucleolar RNA-associated protein 10